MTINNGGAVNVSGVLGLCSNSIVSIDAGASLTVNGTFAIGCNVTNGGTSSYSPGSFGVATNNGGVINATATTLNSGNATAAGNPLFVINGGINNLGNVDIGRPSGSSQNALGTDGLIIYGGLVNMTSLRLGNNNWATMLVSPGTTVTNTGNGIYRNATTARPSRMLQTGGLFVTLGTNLFIPSTAAGNGVTYSVTGGTNYSTGFQFGDASANLGTVNFTNAATIFVGSSGISSNGVVVVNISLNAGGRFGASADWTNSTPISLNGGVLDAEDAAGIPHNIYSLGILRGSGAMTKTGLGTLTLGAANTYLSSTFIQNGTLALGANGSLASSLIVVGSNTLFDVSSVSGGYILPSSKTLGGWGVVVGDTTVALTGTINPGTNSATGTLTFSNSLTETGGAISHFDLSSNPSGPNNDLIVVKGDLNISGVSNIVEISGGGASGSVHPLFRYSGNFNGSLANFSVSGPLGVLTNDTSANPKTIAFIVSSSVRVPTNVVWAGNAIINNWDTLNLTNWLNNGALDFFVTGDNALFNSVGSANSDVNISGSVLPASVMVAYTGDYVFSGSGSIGGVGGIIKTNSGRLTILNTNNFVGGISIKGGQ